MEIGGIISSGFEEFSLFDDNEPIGIDAKSSLSVDFFSDSIEGNASIFDVVFVGVSVSERMLIGDVDSAAGMASVGKLLTFFDYSKRGLKCQLIL